MYRPDPAVPGLPDRMPGAEQVAAPPPTRIGGTIAVLLAGIVLFWGGLGSWAALSSIQGAVVAPGTFQVDGNLPAVQHLEGGIVRTVFVREGERVAAGQRLVELEDTLPGAEDRMLANQLVNALASDLRLAAEFAGLDAFQPDDELTALMAMDPSFREAFDAQLSLFATNNEMWHGQAEILTQRLAEQSEQLEGLRAQADAIRARLDLVQEELSDLGTLFDQGLVTKPRLMSRRDAEAAMFGDLAFTHSQIEGLNQRISETRVRMLQLRRDRARAISQERQQVKALLFDIRQRLIANEDVRRRLVVRAPVSGRVLGLAVSSPGEVIGEGDTILSIVPDGADFIVEGQVRPEDVDQVAEGSVARLRLTAYNFRTTPPVSGEVVHVSPDSFLDRQTGQAYFTVHVRLDDHALSDLPDVEVTPGMPAQIMIATRPQTVANYLLGPLRASLDTALRETD